MKSLKLYLGLAVTVLIIYLIAEANQPKSINWAETLSNKDKIPFGTYILYNRTKDIFHGSNVVAYRQPIYNVLAEDSVTGASYIIICPGTEFAKTDYEQLEKYVKAGNDVFIASGYFGKLFKKNLQIETKDEFKINYDDVPLRFLNPALHPDKYYSVDKGADISFFSKFDTLHSVVLGENKDHKANFIKYTLGKGSLYLLSNPKMFSNYSLLKPQGAEYAATALSYIKNTKEVVWDEYYTQGDDDGEDTPMRVFLSNAALQWAYYITIFSLLVFVLFEIKRRQRIIPVIEPLRNSSLDFVTVVGQVYYEKRSNANIANKKIIYLLAYLRDEFQLKTSTLDEEFIEKLSDKLGLDPNIARRLVNQINSIGAQTHVTDKELIELNQLIEKIHTSSE